MSVRLRKRRALKYIDEDHSSVGREEAKLLPKKIFNEVKKSSSKIPLSGKSKNTELDFSSDEEFEKMKKNYKFDMDNLGEYPYKTKTLLDKPEELEGLDIKQYYDNPVRCCFDDPSLAFSPM